MPSPVLVGVTAYAALGGFVFGFDLGVIAGVLPSMTRDLSLDHVEAEELWGRAEELSRKTRAGSNGPSPNRTGPAQGEAGGGGTWRQPEHGAATARILVSGTARCCDVRTGRTRFMSIR